MNAGATPGSAAARLAAVISPLRRNLLGATRATAGLPEIPEAQIDVIRALPRGAVHTSGDLAAALGLSRSTVSNLLGGMEARGLIARRSPDRDRRRVEVIATPDALDLFARFDAASAVIVADALAELSDDDRAAMVAALPALERLRDVLGSARSRAGSDETQDGAA